MKRDIPSRVEIVCDACGVKCEGANYRMRGHLHLKRDALDFHGNACADASVERDLCDRCLNAIGESINTASERIKSGHVDAPAATATVNVDIVFDGPPSHESGRFVEVEVDGRSVGCGYWHERPDGLWALVVPVLASAIRAQEAEA